MTKKGHWSVTISNGFENVTCQKQRIKWIIGNHTVHNDDLHLTSGNRVSLETQTNKNDTIDFKAIQLFDKMMPNICPNGFFTQFMKPGEKYPTISYCPNLFVIMFGEIICYDATFRMKPFLLLIEFYLQSPRLRQHGGMNEKELAM